MKQLFVVSVLALAIVVSLACEGPAPTPAAPALTTPPAATPALTSMPSPTPTVAPTPTQRPTAARAPTPTPTPEPTTAPTPTPAPEPDPAAAAGEQINLTPCGRFECGSIQVPADYRDPEAGSINIAVNVRRATSPDQRIGYLLVNPGGPGSSGIELAASSGNSIFTDVILERFDIVGFDPRGVGLSDKLVAALVAAYERSGIDPPSVFFGGGSEPEFACGGHGEQLALLSSIDMPIDTPEEIAIGEAAANLCIQSMGPVGALLHSEYVARDMDEIRKALGAEQISYLGFSYGSELGVWYATLFPDSVRAMAVDGARNPFPSDPDRQETESRPEAPKPKSVSGTAAREARVAAALTACADPACPIYNDGDPVGYFQQAAAKIDLVNAAAGNHPRAGYLGVYRAARDEVGWPDLWQGLFELYENDDPAILLKYARKESNIRALGAGFNSHVNCLDKWVLYPELNRATRLEEEAKQFANQSKNNEKYPLLGPISDTLPQVCTFYDRFAPEPLAGPFDGGGVPILVIGNHDDPATSFSDSAAVATEVLSNGYLVETSHFKHVVYPGNQCVNDHVHRALIEGVYPSARQVFCEREESVAATPAPETAATGEQIDWSPCQSGLGLQCGFVAVPADYRDPAAGSIRIAVNVHRATSPDKRIGYLLMNPGGPGGSGLELAQGVPTGRFPHKLAAHFDVVGFDPRGVGASNPAFACGDLGEQHALLATIDGDIDTPEELAAGEAAANLCIQSMGSVGGRLHTEYVARDMDEIRQALGAEQISYLGFSYGSALGVWYATLFPESVRAMVVDGASNPVGYVTNQEERIAEELEQLSVFSALLERALTACADPECPIYNDGDPVGYYRQAAAKLHLVNAAADNNPHAGYLGVITTLYNEQFWPYLWRGLWELNENDDPSILLSFAEVQMLGREFGEANFTAHVNCLDGWVLQPEYDRATRLADAKIGTAAVEEMLPLIALTDIMAAPNHCTFYDQFAPKPLEGPLDGGGVPILVIGNHSDPATPFIESEELVTETLSNGYLVETDHFQHTVYPGNRCVNQHVHRALIDNERPSEQRVLCEREDWAADSNR